MNNKHPLVSVSCLAYNQVNFIRQALDGFVMQKTNFSFEVLINDDASTDGTADIIREYEKKYPDIIKPIYQLENQYSKKISSISKTFIFPRVKGKYLAFCEGDDYWTDPNKLQKQVDFLESHPDYSICFHRANTFYEYGSNPSTTSHNMIAGRTDWSLEYLLKTDFIMTASVMYRLHEDIKELIPNNILSIDWYLHLLHAKVGKIGFIDEVMSAYRRHQGGMVSGNWNDVLLRHGMGRINFRYNVYKNIADESKDYYKIFMQDMFRVCDLFVKNNKIKELLEVHNTYPQYFLECFKYGGADYLKREKTKLIEKTKNDFEKKNANLSNKLRKYAIRFKISVVFIAVLIVLLSALL
ncbi:MAG: glycosyltransferase, partial [Elusimicrobiota bacterium]|nr:glycosyltransferase [Elusimicrobiota bacterium]